MIDVRTELEAFHWTNATWTSGKLIAASPLRYEQHPSFAVMLDHGGWRDWGADDPYWQSGNFTKLLAFLRNETYEETAEYLSAKYGDGSILTYDDEGRPIFRPPDLLQPRIKPRRIPQYILDNYRYRSDYLGRRGISEDIQRLMAIGYDMDSKAVTIPWFNSDGSLGNVMYRKTRGKTFWYRKDSRPIGEMLYGIHLSYKHRLKSAAIVEAPIDGLTLMSNGVYGIATGGTAVTDAKIALILRSPIEELTIWRDQDGAGRTWQRRLVTALRGKIRLKIAKIPKGYKDVNEMVCAGVRVDDVNIRSVTIF